ncbi:MAG: hypothetical protein ABIZ49_04530 [Opitutaceae bacterium]
MKRSLLILLVAAALFIAWWLHRPTPEKIARAQQRASSATPPVDLTKTSASTTVPESRSELAGALNSPTTDIHGDLRLVGSIVDTFRTNFPRDGNPTGNNAEITATLTGRNKLKLALIPPDHPAINATRELCDRWGTPFFFHAESARKMEIRSAGPDRKMWTEDDVAFAP